MHLDKRLTKYTLDRSLSTIATNGLNGRADEVMIWNRALTAAEILQVYKRGGNRVEFQYQAFLNSESTATTPDFNYTNVNWN